MSRAPCVRTGLEVLCAQSFAPLRGLQVGLVTHPAAVDSQFCHAAELLAQAPAVRLAVLFGPEHGLLGEAQDLVGVGHGQDPSSGLRVYSLYGDTVDSLRPTDEQLRGLDALVIDLQDVGSRYYTFQATMLFCLEAAARRKMLTVVLDRPNPLGGVAVEGPLLQPGYESFVGPHPVVTRHGMTLGELARLYQAERGLSGELQVIACEGWRRDLDFDQTGLPWVLPSPNMPTVETAFVYPGQCLLEGTNLSEGRGTTRPFELCGAPGVDAIRLRRRLHDEGLPGVAFRPVWFRPTFHKFAGRTCGGVQIHVTDREAFQPVRTGLAVLAALREESGGSFDWRREPYEFVADRLAIDLLFGSDRERRALEAGRPPAEIARAWEAEEEAFRQRRRPFLLYC
ncbi:MAG TPA: DUF1343 domain-containing protein [Gemmataceae bacterium]|nr:DUF1343 domain-containing protein [Gemmataceae bacterium]